MKLLSIVFVCIAFQFLATAQPKTNAFEEITIAVGVQKNINQNYFHEHWESSSAFQIDTETPFYAGNFFIDLRYDEFSSLKDDVPGFRNVQFSTGWGIRKEIFGGLEAGGAVGALFSMFYYDQVSEERARWVKGHLGSLSPENEAGFVFEADLSYPIFKNWGVRLSASRSLVYTHSKVKLNYAGIGVYHTFSTPKWLFEVLE